MKRVILVVAILIISASLCFADTDYLHNTKAGSIPVYGFLGSYWILSVQTIDHGGGTVGMHFDLLGDDITFNANVIGGGSVSGFDIGRLIAYWTLVVDLANNQAWSLTIDAQPLRLVSNEPDNTEIDYYLEFNIDFNDDINKDWIAKSGTPVTYSIAAEQITSYRVFSLLKQIRFMLDDYEQDDRYGWPDGEYSADVRLTLESN